MNIMKNVIKTFPWGSPKTQNRSKRAKKPRFLIFRGLEQNPENARGKMIIQIRIRIGLKIKNDDGHVPLRHN